MKTIFLKSSFETFEKPLPFRKIYMKRLEKNSYSISLYYLDEQG